MAAVTPTTDGRTLPVVNEKQSLKTSGLSLSGPLLGHAAEAEATATTADSSSASAASSTSAHARKSRSAKKVQQRKGSVRRIELEKRGFLKKKKKTSTGNVRGSVHTGSMRGGVRTQEKEKDLLVYAIEHVTRIYGMALLSALFNSLMAYAFSLVPWTRWNSLDGIPRYDQTILMVYWVTQSILVVTQHPVFAIAGYDPPSPMRQWNGWRYALLGTLPAYLVVGLLCNLVFVAIPTALQVDYRFYLLDVLSALPIAIGSVVFAEYLQLWVYKRDRKTGRYKKVVGENIIGDMEGNQGQQLAVQTNVRRTKTVPKLKIKKKEIHQSCFELMMSLMGLLSQVILNIFYPIFVLAIFRSNACTDTMRTFIVCFMHPALQEMITLSIRNNKMEEDDLYEFESSHKHLALAKLHMVSMTESLMIYVRRFMLGCIHDPAIAMVAIVITGLEEAIMRCTMVHRDRFYRWLIGKPPLTEKQLVIQRRIWASNAVLTMFFEIAAIITARLGYLFMKPHRFVFNLGYGFSAGTEEMTGTGMIFVSIVVELCFELLVDMMAIQIEYRDGVDVAAFWEMWHLNARAFFPLHFCDSLNGLLFSFWAFLCTPNPVFCKSTDPCSCVGGGFEIYKPFCDIKDAEQKLEGANTTLFTTPSPSPSFRQSANLTKVAASAASEFSTVPTFLQDNITSILASMLVAVFIALVFLITRFLQEKALAADRSLELDRRQQIYRKEKERTEEEAKFLEDKLQDVQKQLNVEIKAKQIVYEDIKFEEGEDAIIGKGAFGVVRLAHYQGETVAVKQVKVAACKAFWKEEDAKAVKDFVSEIAIMSPLRHPNIIFFYGGVWLEGASRMCLVVEYAGRGSLDEWIGHPELEWEEFGASIARDIARGMSYLHSRRPALVHRDLKPANVMLMASFTAKIADFGECAEAKGSMKGGALVTVRGTPTFMAPEVVRAERHGPPADVFSFALLLLELASGITTEDRFKALGKDPNSAAFFHSSGERLDPALSGLQYGGYLDGADIEDLVKRCWRDDPKRRPQMADCLQILNKSLVPRQRRNATASFIEGSFTGDSATVMSFFDDTSLSRRSGSVGSGRVLSGRTTRRRPNSRLRTTSLGGTDSVCASEPYSPSVGGVVNADERLEREAQALKVENAELKRKLTSIMKEKGLLDASPGSESRTNDESDADDAHFLKLKEAMRNA